MLRSLNLANSFNFACWLGGWLDQQSWSGDLREEESLLLLLRMETQFFGHYSHYTDWAISARKSTNVKFVFYCILESYGNVWFGGVFESPTDIFENYCRYVSPERLYKTVRYFELQERNMNVHRVTCMCSILFAFYHIKYFWISQSTFFWFFTPCRVS
jgi:hypothetical protein